MSDLKQLTEVLQALGFVDCRDGVWQRKTENTNLIVRLGDISVGVWHGASNIARQYAFSQSPTVFWLELEVSRATISQLLSAMSYRA